MSKHGTILKQGEAESRTTQVIGDVVEMHHVTMHSAAGLVVMDWGFDFTDVDRVKLMELASRSLVIDQRNAWKKLSSDAAVKDGQTKQTFVVAELLNKQRRGKTDAEKVAVLFADKSPEEVAAMIAFATK